MSLLSAIARAFSMIAGLRHANAALGRAARREIAALKPLTAETGCPCAPGAASVPTGVLQARKVPFSIPQSLIWASGSDFALK